MNMQIMNYPKERFMVRGRRLDDGTEAVGYLFSDTAPCSLKAKGKCACPHDGSSAVIFAWDDGLHEYDEYEVDPATIEPVALPVLHEPHLVGEYKCPSCRACFVESLGRASFCGECGQRLGWSEESQ